MFCSCPFRPLFCCDLPELGRKAPALQSGDIRPRPFLWFSHKFSGVLKYGPRAGQGPM